MKIADLELGDKPLFLAPMEDVTDPSFRSMCKEFGADVVYTEFISSDGLIRDAAKSLKKLEITEAERPVGIQIYGHLIEPMVEAARMAEAAGPDIIDINFGCPMKKIAGRGAGSGNGKTAGYGHKGQKARSGAKKAGFEGGQMPLQRRLPKRGFNNIFATEYATIKVSDLEKFEAGSTVDANALIEKGIIKKTLDGVKVLGNGTLTKALNVNLTAYSASAKEKIEKAGGKAEVI